MESDKGLDSLADDKVFQYFLECIVRNSMPSLKNWKFDRIVEILQF